jgi:hypothetical protein
MEQYLLTQEDIDRLGITGVMAGEPAEEDELRALFPAQMNERDQLARQALLSSMDMPATVGGSEVEPVMTNASANLPYKASEILPPDALVAQQITGTTAPIVPSAGEDVGAPLQARGIESLLASVATQPTTPEDPYSNLSKTQRRMLAYAAISDAGAALQGKQGTMVTSLLGDFTERADQRRKAQAAQMQQQALQQMMGVGGVQLDLSTPDAIRSHIDQLTTLGMAYPSLAPTIANRIKVLQDEAERLTKQTTQATSQMSGLAAVDALLTSPNLGAITGFEGTINEFFSTIGAAPKYSDLKSYISQLQGLNFLEAYQQLKGGGPITDIEGRQATQARTRLEDAMKSTPENLRVALLEVRKLFQDALDKNPTYTGTGELTSDERKYLE